MDPRYIGEVPPGLVEPDRDSIQVRDRTLKDGFVVVSRRILKWKDISLGARVCYAMLLSYAWQDGSCFPGQKRLGDDIGVGVRQVQRYLDELEQEGLVIIETRGLMKTNVYILPPLDAVTPRNQVIHKPTG